MTSTVVAPRAAAGAIVAGCALLLLRPELIQRGSAGVPVLVALFVLLLAFAGMWPLRGARLVDVRAGVALAVGASAFVVGRAVVGGPAMHGPVLRMVILNSLAAVAEEALFRRLLYGLLEPRGPAVAIAVSSIAFAIVHVTVYGLWVLPIDVAAGLVLSWQRWASGTWRVPAVTHVLANLLVVL